ncbi:MAG: hypothetical protein SNF33_07165 [Candidatus Algichlamydia australiensis]|nr:hypothetical protein [Chlamydiales bacterium]
MNATKLFNDTKPFTKPHEDLGDNKVEIEFKIVQLGYLFKISAEKLLLTKAPTEAGSRFLGMPPPTNSYCIQSRKVFETVTILGKDKTKDMVLEYGDYDYFLINMFNWIRNDYKRAYEKRDEADGSKLHLYVKMKPTKY